MAARAERSGGGENGATARITGRAACALIHQAAELGGEALSLRPSFAEQAVTVLPGNRVFYAATLGRAGEFGGYGVHTGLAVIGAAIGQDRVDTTFGNGGAQSAAFRPVGGSCTGALVPQWMSALTTWAGLPVFVGTVDMACSNPDLRTDYLVGRVLVDRIFVGGFQ